MAQPPRPIRPPRALRPADFEQPIERARATTEEATERRDAAVSLRNRLADLADVLSELEWAPRGQGDTDDAPAAGRPMVATWP